jgi:hypothetical protein
MRIRNSPLDWALNEQEKTEVLLHWASGSIRKADIIIRDFLKKNPA